MTPQEWSEYVRRACMLPQTAACLCGHAKGSHENSRYVSSLPRACHADGCDCAEFKPTDYRP